MSKTKFPQMRLEVEIATIANGQTTSGAVDSRGRTLVALLMPAAFTGATVSYSVSFDGITYREFYDANNTKVVHTVAANRHIGIPPVDFSGCRFIKAISASAEGAERQLQLIFRGG